MSTMVGGEGTVLAPHLRFVSLVPGGAAAAEVAQVLLASVLPEKGCGPKLLGPHETALFSVAVDSRCQLHLLPSRRSVPVWLLLLLCVGLIIVTILLLQTAFPGFL